MFDMLKNFLGRLETKKLKNGDGGEGKTAFFPHLGLYLTIRQDTFELLMSRLKQTLTFAEIKS